MKRVCVKCKTTDEKPRPPYEMSYCERCGKYELCADVEYFPDVVKSIFGNLK